MASTSTSESHDPAAELASVDKQVIQLTADIQTLQKSLLQSKESLGQLDQRLATIQAHLNLASQTPTSSSTNHQEPIPSPNKKDQTEANLSISQPAPLESRTHYLTSHEPAEHVNPDGGRQDPDLSASWRRKECSPTGHLPLWTGQETAPQVKPKWVVDCPELSAWEKNKEKKSGREGS